MARKNLPDYPTSIGDKRLSVFVHTGPAVYAVIAVATPPTGGDVVQAGPEAGLKYFDHVTGGVSDDGQFRVEAVYPAGNSASAAGAAQASTTVRLRWIVVATGLEVAGGVNLSGRTVRLKAIGPK
jgi:hypothetical protein